MKIKNILSDVACLFYLALISFTVWNLVSSFTYMHLSEMHVRFIANGILFGISCVSNLFRKEWTGAIFEIVMTTLLILTGILVI